MSSNNGVNQHVVPRVGSWAVVSEGAGRASNVMKTQKEAIAIGRERAIKNESELLIHGENGKIRRKYSYGRDPKDIPG